MYKLAHLRSEVAMLNRGPNTLITHSCRRRYRIPGLLCHNLGPLSRWRDTKTIILPACLFAALALAASAAIAAEDPSPAQSNGDRKEPGLRKYADGPLKAADFAGKPPDTLPAQEGIRIVANTHSIIRYNYRYQSQESRLGRWTATLSQFDCFAAIDPDQCWNMDLESRRVLDHEQGHFDLAEIWARRAAERMRELSKAGKLAARGENEAGAKKLLNQRVEAAMKQIFDSLQADQEAYDRETRHGTHSQRQREHRQRHRELLQELPTAER